MYHALLIIHLTSAIVWVGAVFMGTFIDWPVIRAASGRKFPLDFIVGQVMRASGGKANPQAVNELLKKKLGV